MTDSSSRPNSPHSSAGDAPKPRIVSGSLRDRIAKFNNADAVPLIPVNPYVGNASMQSYARGGLVGNRIPNLDPKTAGMVNLGPGGHRVRVTSESGRGMIGNRIPSGSDSGRAGLGFGAASSSGSVRSSSPTGSVASSSAAASSSAISAGLDSTSVTTSMSSSPATSPEVQLPPQLVLSSLPDVEASGAMTPSSTIAEAGDQPFDRSMPATPIAGATAQLPPPVHDLVAGNLTLATGGLAGINHTPSLSSSMASNYDPESVNEEQDNLKDVSGVSTPTGTPRQAHRDLDDVSIAGSARSGGKGDDLDHKLKSLALEDKDGAADADSESGKAADAPPIVERGATPTISDPITDVAATGAPLRPVVSPEVLAAEEALKKAEEAASTAEAAVKPAQTALEAAEESIPDTPATLAMTDSQPPTPLITSVNSVEEEPKKGDVEKEDTIPEENKETKDKEEEKTPTDGPSKTDPPATETGTSEVLAESDDADGKDDTVRPRASEDTLRPMRPVHTGSDSVHQTPIILPNELADGGEHDLDMPVDRDATPQPPGGDSDHERDETPMPLDSAPALDDTSDIVSVPGGAPSEHGFDDEASPNQFDIGSNRSSMPPARASSELEFRYEEYADQFFRDSQQQRDPTDGAAASPITATANILDGRRETRAGSIPSSTGSNQEPSVNGGSNIKNNAGVSVEDEEKRFPSVPTDSVDGNSSHHKPLQVHVEPSPYGPLVASKTVDDVLANSGSVDLTVPPAPQLTVEAPSPRATEFDDGVVGNDNDAPTPSFPSAPATDLPEVKTPSVSNAPSRTPTPPRRTSSLQGRAFPAVPDEEHPYVGVHISPHGSTSPATSFPRADSGRKNSSSSIASGRSNASGRSIHTPEPRLSVDSNGTPRKKRNSFTPRSPYLDDEDPGDFEPGEGWAVVSKWEPWRGSPTPSANSGGGGSNQRKQRGGRKKR